MANYPPFAPWVHHKNSSSTSLSRLGSEVAIPPGQTVPALPPANDYPSKELPPIPKMSDPNRKRPLSDQTAAVTNPKGKNIVRSQHNNRIDGAPRPPIGSKSHSLPESASRLVESSYHQPFAESNRVLPPPPPPPMTKSAQKILQLTGFDPSFDQPTQLHYSVSPESSASSGSQYSQPESEPQDYGAVPGNDWESTSMAPTRGEPSAALLRSSTYSVSEKSASVSELSVAAVAATTVSTSSLQTRDRPAMKDQRRVVDLATEDSMENMTNEEFMILEKARYEQQKRSRFDDGFERDISSRYGHDMTDADRRDLIPRPLALRPKEKSRLQPENEKLGRNYTTPVSPTGMPYDEMPVGSRMQPPSVLRPVTKRSLGSRKHPLKSTFPFSSTQKGSESGEPEQKFSKKISRAMERLSGGKKPPMKQTIISNSQREPNGPDTPMPSSFGFPAILQKGNEHLQDAVDKAKKGLKIRTADERKRENLKKKIFVVGITDQSPDGRVSEWL